MGLSDAQILTEYVERFGKTGFDSLESLLTSPAGMGLETATPAQRAICRIAEGRPLRDLADNPDVAKMMGLTTKQLKNFHPTDRPRELVLISGIRTAKSLLAATIAIRATQTCGLDHLRAGEIPRYSIVSLSKDLASVVLHHLMGSLLASPSLSRLIYDQNAAKKWLKDGKPVGESVVLRHPTGRPVEIKVTAAKRAGASLVSRWSIGCCFDECARMLGAGDGVINLDDARAAVMGRLVPNAQVVMISSPWAPVGPIWEMFNEYFGEPSTERVLLKAPGPILNPYWWTPERVERMRLADEQVYRTDVCAEFCDIEESLLSSYIEDATREALTIPYAEGGEYVAAMDPATRSNAWTLVIVTRKGTKKQVVLAQQWQGTPLNPLRPIDVLREIRDLCLRYGVRWAYSDQFAAEALQDLASTVGFELVIEDWNKTNKVQLFMELRAQMAQGLIEIPPDNYLLKDLRLVKRRVTQTGVSIIFPKTSDNRHCDYAPSLARALGRWISDIDPGAPLPGDVNYGSHLEDRLEAEDLQLLDKDEDKDWWTQ